MNFLELRDFISKKMRMSHIYQPVMIKSLLINKGKLTDIEIAEQLLKYDGSQIEYYQNVTNNMVGKVLRSHNIVSKEKNIYSLNGFVNLNKNEIKDLIIECSEKIDEFILKRGDQIWNHRKKSKGYIPGSIKYDVLKRAKFRCELCGISAEFKALEVDHIVPRNKGGEDSVNNYQALCYTCNATKRDKDDTDYRNKINYDFKKSDCLFCGHKKVKIINENNLSYTVRDNFPVTKFHTLIIPKRHTASYFDLTQAEINSVSQLMEIEKYSLNKSDISIEGFNIGINDGHAAGQTILHCHIHLIPRRIGDVENPRGGVRHIIPGKGYY